MNIKGADQTARMRRLVSAIVVPKHRRQVFSHRGQLFIVMITPITDKPVHDDDDDDSVKVAGIRDDVISVNVLLKKFKMP